MLTATEKPNFPAKAAVVCETRNHPQINTNAPSATNLALHEIVKQTYLHHPHIIIQNDTEFDEDPPMQHQDNLHSRVH